MSPNHNSRMIFAMPPMVSGFTAKDEIDLMGA